LVESWGANFLWIRIVASVKKFQQNGFLDLAVTAQSSFMENREHRSSVLLFILVSRGQLTEWNRSETERGSRDPE
jgi:hypothetical protein